MMSKKPIYLFVAPFFPSPKSWRGGYFYDMVRALQRVVTGKYDVKVLVSGEGDYEYGGVRVYGFLHKMLPSDLFSFLLGRINARYFNTALKRIGIAWQDVAVCHTHTFDLAYVTWAAKLANPNVFTVMHHHCINPIRLTSWRLGYVPIHATALYFYRRTLSEQIDVHVFCSRQSRVSYAKRYRHGKPECGFEDIQKGLLFGRFFRSFRMKESLVLYNGVDSDVFKNDGSRRHDNVFRIGCVANFQPLKDQMTLLRAVELLHRSKSVDICTVFVGSGHCLEHCKKYVEDNGLSNIVVFREEMSHLELPAFYRTLDLFVLPSRSEGFCCSYVEAVGCGVPVMGCRGVSIEEVIAEEDKDKWLIEPQNHVELAEKIKAFIVNRWRFRFNRSLDIDFLWKNFLEELEGCQHRN